jgi:hypothetical protein
MNNIHPIMSQALKGFTSEFIASPVMVTPSMVKAWVGSNNLTVDHLIGLLTELANGQYKPDELASDVCDYTSEQLEG